MEVNMDDSAHPVTRVHPVRASGGLCGPAPLIPGEDAAAYEALLARITTLVAPGDVLEELWVRDVVDRVWDIARLHRMKANLIAASASAGVERVLQDLGWIDPRISAQDWARRGEKTVAAVAHGLAAAGLSMDSVMARTFAVRIAELDRIDRMIMAADASRNAALHAVERHRSGLGQRLREAIKEPPSAAAPAVTADAPALSPAS
jgi:hypothetical protein